jgi:hypothetical protein
VARCLKPKISSLDRGSLLPSKADQTKITSPSRTATSFLTGNHHLSHKDLSEPLYQQGTCSFSIMLRKNSRDRCIEVSLEGKSFSKHHCHHRKGKEMPLILRCRNLEISPYDDPSLEEFKASHPIGPNHGPKWKETVKTLARRII